MTDKKVLTTTDSFSEKLPDCRGIDLLMTPVSVPFLTELTVAQVPVPPKPLLPLHEGYAKSFFVAQRHDNYGPYVEKRGLQFHRLDQPGPGMTV